MAEAEPVVRAALPELSKGLEFDLVVLIDPAAFGKGIEGALVAREREGDQACFRPVQSHDIADT
jgi:hypothetical protein